MSLLTTIASDFDLFDGAIEGGTLQSLQADETYVEVTPIKYLTTRGTVRTESDKSYAGASQDAMIVHFRVSDMGGVEVKSGDVFVEASGTRWVVWIVERQMRDIRYRLHCLLAKEQ